MTIFEISDIPSDIDTLEKLTCWTNLALARLYPDKNLVTTTDPSNGSPVTELAAQVGMFAVSTSPVNWVFLGRIALDIDTAWLEGGKPWNYIQSMGDGLIPDNLKLAGDGTIGSAGSFSSLTSSGIKKGERKNAWEGGNGCRINSAN